MSITVVYKDFEDMISQAKLMAARVGGPMVVETPMVGPAAPMEVETPFIVTPPAAPVVTAPVAPVAPVTPTVTPSAAPAQPVTATVLTNAQSYTLDDLARAAVPLVDMGRMDDLQQLLVSFGVSSLPELAPDQYGAFATALRNVGAQI